jgi:coenzyme F420-reducing hydrogenase gamma subunit
MSLEKFYTIVAPIGSGSMGTISRGVQRSLDRTVAIKQIHPHFSHNKDFMGRFEREAKASANLKHVNVLDIIDFITDDDGSTYIVMELIDGPTLADLMRPPARLPLDVALSVVLQMLAGLEHAHNNGIVHRDVKPANVMLTRAGVVKIADFGIAQVSRLPTLTAVGEVFGTPYYMSPEQAMGRPLDHRSDLFSVGISVYEMVTGTLPFQGNTLAVLAKIINEPPPPIASVDPSIPQPLIRFVDRALEKDVNRRFFDAAEMAVALEDLAAELGLRTGPRVCKGYIEGVSGVPGTRTGVGLDAESRNLRGSESRPGSSKQPSGLRPTVALLPLQGCFGCHVNLLDLHERIAEIPKMIDLRFSHLADAKQIQAVDIGLVEGCVANVENEARLRDLRAKCRTLVALGTCASYGGVPGLRNLYSTSQIIERAYGRTESNAVSTVRPDSRHVPALTDRVRPVGAVVDVDVIIPGCPTPPADVIRAFQHLLDGTAPKIPTHNLCVECKRFHRELLTGQRNFIADEVRAPMELETIDPDRCFLEQGVPCMGLVTREGCGARCLDHNAPCHGCMGPPPMVQETGAKWIDSLASLLPGGALRFRHDLVGLGYRYTLPASMMPGRDRDEVSQ